MSCLNRPFDDQRVARIRLETEAIASIFDMIESGLIRQVSSEVAELEIDATPDPIRRERVRMLLPDPLHILPVTDDMVDRARNLASGGILGADALHIAAAECLGATALLTCDGRLIRRARRLESDLRVRVVNPLQWISEHSHASHDE